MTAIFKETPVVGWIERRVPALSNTAFYRIGDGPGRAAAGGHAAAARFISRGRLPMTEATGTIEG
jgi:hypothetical protein